MAPFKGNRYLRCFYCNRSSKSRYDGVTREFLCLYCDATNYLDENGDITDPPVATTAAEPQPTQYAIQRPTSPDPPNSAHSIFCDKCLKNQHLYTASLAQYFPDDPDHPDSEQLERRYYKFRAALEERYPQICAECEPKVLGKLNDAGYVAKTDYLRRVMGRSRTQKTTPRRRTLLGLADGVGRWMFWGSLALQMLWHARAALELLANNLPLGEEGGILPVVLGESERVTQFLPATERLVRLSLQATVLGLWWNPKFPQIVRGFSRPVLGLPKWYAFQALLVVSRYLFPRVVQLEVDHTEEMSAQFAIHLFMAGLVIYVYILATRCVRVDTTPLFAPADISALRPKASQPTQGIKHDKDTSSQNLSDVLDDILNTPNPSRVSAVNDSPISTPLPPAPRINTQTSPQPHYSEEMEWSPTASPPPAFKDVDTKPQPFGQPQSRQELPQRPFWARVPPAPKTPAQRLYNPAPPAAEAIKQDRQHFTARFGGTKLESSGGPERRSVDFSPPSFFPPTGARADPRSGLADMLSSSFSLSQEDEGSPPRRSPGREKSPFALDLKRVTPARPVQDRDARAAADAPGSADAAFLVAILGLWIYAAQNPEAPSSGHMAKASLAMGALHVVHVAARTAGQAASVKRGVRLVLCAAEMCAVGYVAAGMWATGGVCAGGCFEEGLWTVVGMFAHHLWGVFG